MNLNIRSYFLLVILLLFSSCSQKISDNNSPQNNSPNFLAEFQKINSEYQSNEKLNQCLSSSLNICMSDIVTEQATSSMDKTICNDLQNEDFRAECEWSVQLIEAIRENDIEKCTNLSWKLLHNCKINILSLEAFKTWDKEICDTIIDETEGSLNDPSIWLLYTGARESCISNIIQQTAISEEDPSICDEIQDAQNQTYCKEQVISSTK